MLAVLLRCQAADVQSISALAIFPDQLPGILGGSVTSESAGDPLPAPAQPAPLSPATSESLIASPCQTEPTPLSQDADERERAVRCECGGEGV